jgi:2,5-furandicarboxylate decarboxylase 1
MSADLRGFLDALRAQGPDELWVIDEPVSPRYEMTAYAMELERLRYPPALLFESVEGFASPVVCNLFASRKRLAWMLGLEEQTLVSGWASVASARVRPERAEEAPVKDVVQTGSDVDVRQLPLPVHFETDAGPYISSGVVIAKDPDTGIGNLNYTRLQLKGPSVFGASLHSRGDLWDFQCRQEARGEPLEVAVAIGVHPAINIAAATRLPIGDDELELAGALLGEPVAVVPAETVDLMVPAQAELVLEGVIEPNVREDEGPFGEYTGYSTDRSTRHVFTVRAVTHRQNLVFHDIVPGASSEHLNLSKVSRVPRSFAALKQTFSNVVAINYPPSGTHFHCYVSLRDPLPGQAKQVMMMLFGLDMYLKLVVAVDDDVDVYNEQEVLWALATRFQADRDQFVVEGVAANLLDPSLRDGTSAKLGLDATRSPDFAAPKMTVSADVLQKVRARIGQRVSL